MESRTAGGALDVLPPADINKTYSKDRTVNAGSKTVRRGSISPISRNPGSFEYPLTFAAVGCNLRVVSRPGTNHRGQDPLLNSPILPRIAETLVLGYLCLLFTKAFYARASMKPSVRMV
jgi:hypothetical protein